MIKGNSPVVFIQGDTYIYEVTFKDRDFSEVNKVVFSCIALSINKQMHRDTDNEKFVYTFTSTETAKWIPLETTFDIKVFFTDGTIESETGIPLVIVKRMNEMPEPSTTVYWSDIQDIPMAVQSITLDYVNTETEYNVAKLNHIIFGGEDTILTVNDDGITINDEQTLSWTTTTISINGENYNLAELEGDVAAQQQLIADIQAALGTINTRLDGVEGRLDSAEGDIADVKTRLTTAEDEIDSLGGRVTAVEGQIGTVEGRLDSAEGRLDSAEGRLDTLEQEQQGQAQTISNLEGEVDSLDSSMTTVQTSISTMQGQIEEVEDRTEAATQQDIDNLFAQNRGGRKCQIKIK